MKHKDLIKPKPKAQMNTWIWAHSAVAWMPVQHHAAFFCCPLDSLSIVQFYCRPPCTLRPECRGIWSMECHGFRAMIDVVGPSVLRSHQYIDALDGCLFVSFGLPGLCLEFGGLFFDANGLFDHSLYALPTATKTGSPPPQLCDGVGTHNFGESTFGVHNLFVLAPRAWSPVKSPGERVWHLLLVML